MAIRRNSKVNANYSMASMTDIVFLLLIFFLITSTLINPNALRLLLPKSNSQTPSKPLTSVSIKQFGRDEFEYYVEKKPVKFDEIERSLQLLLLNKEEPTIALYSDETVPIGEIVKIMNIALRNKYRLILGTAPE